MPDAAQPRRDPRLHSAARAERAAPYAVSTALHGAIFALVVALPRVEATVLSAEKAISVEIVTPEQFSAALRHSPANPTPAAPAEPASSPNPPEKTAGALEPSQPAPETAAPPEPQDGGVWRHAAGMLSQQALADPRNAKMIKKLALVETNTRLEQLCNLEAILQIERAEPRYHPQFVLAYALGETKVVNDVIIADGAAFFSEKQWRGLSYRCRVEPVRQQVQAFEFAIGTAIPEQEWASHSLPRSIGTGDD